MLRNYPQVSSVPRTDAHISQPCRTRLLLREQSHEKGHLLGKNDSRGWPCKQHLENRKAETQESHKATHLPGWDLPSAGFAGRHRKTEKRPQREEKGALQYSLKGRTLR